MEEICEIAEKSARSFLFSKISPSKVEDINFSVNVEGEKPLSIDMDLEITLSKSKKGLDLEALTEEALKKAFEAVERYLRDQRLGYNI